MGSGVERNVFASDDGTFAVRVPDLDPGLRSWVLSYQKDIPPKAAGWDDAPALFVYRYGKPLRTLALKDVFDTSRFTDRDCFLGPVVTIDSFQEAEGRVTVSTEAGGKKHTAALAFRTGEVVERSGGSDLWGFSLPGGEGWSPEGSGWLHPLLIGAAVVGVCAVAFAGLAVWLVRRQRVRKR